MTALMLLALDGYSDTVAALLGANANVDAASSLGMTALMFAAQRGHPDTVAALLGANADSSLVNFGGQTAMQMVGGSERKQTSFNLDGKIVTLTGGSTKEKEIVIILEAAREAQFGQQAREAEAQKEQLRQQLRQQARDADAQVEQLQSQMQKLQMEATHARETEAKGMQAQVHAQMQASTS